MEKVDEQIAINSVVRTISSQESESTSNPIRMSRFMTILFAVTCGMSVANIYFAQPILDNLSSEFGVEHSTIGILITITQIFYAVGLLLLVPLGDLLNQRKLIIGQMSLSMIALVIVGTASSSTALFVGMAMVGLLAVVTQTLVAFASTMAIPAERGRVVGTITSGIVIGILLARSISGIITDFAGWRFVYLLSAVLMLVMVYTLFRVLPNVERKVTNISYFQLLRSVIMLFAQERILRIRAILAMLIFTVFSILWTPLVLPLSAPPLSLSHTAIGAFGLVGVVGALAAARAGKLADRGYGQKTTGVALTLLLLSWWLISYTEKSLLALVIGIVLLDLAVQAVHVTNQSMIFTLRADARSRLTAGYMVFYSIGSAVGSIASTQIYAHYGWHGVCLLGAAVSALALLFWAMTVRATAAVLK
ncbi:MFS transporter [Paenibacillus sp. L3-i20]|uniref:MFS transporter n=1 Tax=Paenibacillus sp. L3-i20 TaxID=2905833 RepID=UPI001EE00F20|nr:MFS transporter [Paenibacillus sp. L3-i20]GKU77454.1 MFS transporter [Paenibacillus sp. L3-i20]